jgi:hypothetical protein
MPIIQERDFRNPYPKSSSSIVLLVKNWVPVLLMSNESKRQLDVYKTLWSETLIHIFSPLSHRMDDNLNWELPLFFRSQEILSDDLFHLKE